MVMGDLADDDALAELVDGVDVVYHRAARKAKDDPAESRRVNVEGSARLPRPPGGPSSSPPTSMPPAPLVVPGLRGPDRHLEIKSEKSCKSGPPVGV